MQIGLTGASGFVGRALVRAATRRGHEVVAFSRDPKRVVHDTIETRAFSTTAAPDFRGCEAIVHLAGENIAGFWTAAKKRRIRESRIEGARRVVEGIRAASPEVFVCASAIGYYAGGGETELHEDAPPGRGFLAEVCQATEREAIAAENTCRVARLRFGIVLGPGGGALGQMLPVFRLGLGGKLGDGRQWWSWIHLEDLATMLLFAVENMEVRGVLNATSPWPVRNADFTRVLAKLLHRPAFTRVPRWALKLLFRDLAGEFLESRRVAPAAATALDFPFKFPELEPALRDALA